MRKALPTTRRRAREREVRVRIILDAAARVFAESGYHRATMAAIARAAEISLGGLYALFPGKAHLYGELVSLKQRELIDALKRGADLRPRGRLGVRERRALAYALGEAVMRYFEQNEPFFRIYVNESAALGWNIRATLGDQAFELYEEVVRMMAAAVGAGRRTQRARSEARTKALATIGALNALITEWVTHKGRKPLGAYLVTLRHIIERVVD